ncbi:MAG: hypothetical protein OER21_15095 [Gemmatimonadota bacterium]|nr:hypothetical protein [Gemmatimonadota bacterium]
MRTTWILVLLVGLAGPLAAQVRPTPEAMREQIVRRFIENYRTQAGLTDEQYARLQTTVRQSWEQRRQLQERERDLLRGLEAQLRPGIAANTDSVTRLLDGLLGVQSSRVDLARRDQEEFAQFLNPVQRAQLVMAFARLERQIEQLIQRRGEGPRRFQ